MSQNSRLSIAFDAGHLDLPDGNVVVLRAHSDPVLNRFDTIMAVQSFKPEYDRLEQMGISVSAEIPSDADSVIVELGRSKGENLAMISRAHQMLPDGGVLIVDGYKTDGIESILKLLRKIVPINGVFSKSHGKTIWLTKSGQTPDVMRNWASAIEPRKNRDGFFTADGMFSADHIDPASQLLIAQITKPLAGMGADLGAGWGWLSHQALSEHEKIKTMELIEAEKTAIDCAKRNIDDPRAIFEWQDVTKFSGKSRFDFVLCNPPFHQSRKADPELGRQFIRKAAEILNPKGTLYLVANKQLAYETVLDETFQSWEYMAQTSQYKTIRADRPKASRR
ncbi:MFS transporter [Amylibacter ulvae]|uniref:MFS transporter n=1 Tax=Paramylibacter ulvae TaxID=1651968 RepID=A0ABQ3D876_9RHOB|nr:methyltransferase [Amylibacter ulvae]GHA57816.1 MFS transporter [Amylibacter ulvae]